MTLYEAIAHARETGERLSENCETRQCGLEHLQLAKWLEELQKCKTANAEVKNYNEKIKELGISPTPWKAESSDVFDAEGSFIVDASMFTRTACADACIMSAAPELYDALSDILNMYPLDMDDNEYVVAVRNKAYAALAKARGRSEDGMAKEQRKQFTLT